MAFIQDQVNGLIKTFEGSLKKTYKKKALQLPFKCVTFALKDILNKLEILRY